MEDRELDGVDVKTTPATTLVRKRNMPRWPTDHVGLPENYDTEDRNRLGMKVVLALGEADWRLSSEFEWQERCRCDLRHYIQLSEPE